MKHNLARKPPGLRYRIAEHGSGDNSIPYVVWEGTTPLSAQGALDGPQRHTGADEERAGKQRVRAAQIQWLTDVLRDAGEPMEWDAILARAAKEKFSSPRTLERARDDAGFRPVYGEHGRRTSKWELPYAPPPLPAPPTEREQPEAHSAIPPRPAVVGLEPLFGGGMAEWESGGNAPSPTVDPLSMVEPSTLASDTERDAWLDAQRLECDVCHDASTLVTRYFRPWWVVRCPPHNPSTYAAPVDGAS